MLRDPFPNRTGDVSWVKSQLDAEASLSNRTGDVSWVKSQLDAEGIPFPIELVM